MENSSSSLQEGATPGKLFVGGLSWSTSPERLQEYFSQYGEVREALVLNDPVTKRSRGFGFVTFSEPAGVEIVQKILAQSYHTLDGKAFEARLATPRKERRYSPSQRMVTRTKKIFIGGLAGSTTMEDIKKYFERFGPVEDACIMFDELTNRHKGFGFVTFQNEDVVDKICEIRFHEINNTNRKMVECKKATPRPRVPADLVRARDLIRATNYANGLAGPYPGAGAGYNGNGLTGFGLPYTTGFPNYAYFLPSGATNSANEAGADFAGVCAAAGYYDYFLAQAYLQETVNKSPLNQNACVTPTQYEFESRQFGQLKPNNNNMLSMEALSAITNYSRTNSNIFTSPTQPFTIQPGFFNNKRKLSDISEHT